MNINVKQELENMVKILNIIKNEHSLKDIGWPTLHVLEKNGYIEKEFKTVLSIDTKNPIDVFSHFELTYKGLNFLYNLEKAKNDKAYWAVVKA